MTVTVYFFATRSLYVEMCSTFRFRVWILRMDGEFLAFTHVLCVDICVHARITLYSMKFSTRERG